MRVIEFADGFESSTAPTFGFIVAAGLAVYPNDAAFVTAKGSAAALGDVYKNSTVNQIRFYNGTAWQEVVSSHGAQSIDGVKTFLTDIIVDGNLTVNGTQTVLNTSVIESEDAQIVINNGGNQAAAQNLAGLLVEMSDATDVTIKYDSALASRWKIGDDGSESEVITADDLQVLQNKTYDGGLATDTNKTILPKETTAALSAMTNVEGLIAYDTTKARPVFNNSLGWASIGGEPDVEFRTISAGEDAAKQLTLAAAPGTPSKTRLFIKTLYEAYYGDDFVVTGTTLDWSGLGLDGVLVAGMKIRVTYWS